MPVYTITNLYHAAMKRDAAGHLHGRCIAPSPIDPVRQVLIVAFPLFCLLSSPCHRIHHPI